MEPLLVPMSSCRLLDQHRASWTTVMEKVSRYKTFLIPRVICFHFAQYTSLTSERRIEGGTYIFFLLHICIYLLHWYFISFFSALCGYNIPCLKNKCHTSAHRELKKQAKVQVFTPKRTRPSTRLQSTNCS
jgi:hypothetical protein